MGKRKKWPGAYCFKENQHFQGEQETHRDCDWPMDMNKGKTQKILSCTASVSCLIPQCTKIAPWMVERRRKSDAYIYMIYDIWCIYARAKREKKKQTNKQNISFEVSRVLQVYATVLSSSEKLLSLHCRWIKERQC